MFEAGIFLIVKKLFYGLIYVWLTLLLAGASAHAVHHGSHHSVQYIEQKVEAAQHATTNEKQSQAAVHTASHTAAAGAEASHADTCDHSHCGHGQVAGLLTREGSGANIDTVGKVPTSRTSWSSSHIANNIERPKWRATTPAVVNLQS